MKETLGFNKNSSNLFCRVSVIFTVGTKKRVRLPDRKLLKRIGLITLASTASLAAWTGINPPLLRVYESDNGLKFVTCDYGSWEYVILAGKHDSLYYRVSKIYRAPAKKRLHIPDRKVLERLGLITLSSTASVAAWTSISPPQLRVYDSDNGLKFVTCGNGSWEHAIVGGKYFINQFKPNKIFNYYQLDLVISVIRVVW